MSDYDPVAPFYDKIHGSRKQTIRYLKKLLKAFHPDAKLLLALACGTCRVEKALPRKFEISGLDVSFDMLEEAKKRLPKANFYHQDMLDFEIDKTFDVITCLFASLNHMLDFEDWKKFFQNVADHMNPGGIFIFDVLTEVCLYNLVLNSPLITRVGKLLAIGEFSMTDDRTTDWFVRGFNVTKDKQEELFSTHVQQVAFDREVIEAALYEVFSEVVVEDPEQGEVNERSELLYFICLK
jgi:SAM-dependent methyltransferase